MSKNGAIIERLIDIQRGISRYHPLQIETAETIKLMNKAIPPILN